MATRMQLTAACINASAIYPHRLEKFNFQYHVSLVSSDQDAISNCISLIIWSPALYLTHFSAALVALINHTLLTRF
jgi:uncharacterized membrane protein